MPQEEKIKWYYKPLAVLVLLFLIGGPLALPLLYRSPCFTRTAKVLLTIAVVLFTLYLMWASLEILRKVLELQRAINNGY